MRLLTYSSAIDTTVFLYKISGNRFHEMNIKKYNGTSFIQWVQGVEIHIIWDDRKIGYGLNIPIGRLFVHSDLTIYERKHSLFVALTKILPNRQKFR